MWSASGASRARRGSTLPAERIRSESGASSGWLLVFFVCVGVRRRSAAQPPGPCRRRDRRTRPAGPTGSPRTARTTGRWSRIDPLGTWATPPCVRGRPTTPAVSRRESARTGRSTGGRVFLHRRCCSTSADPRRGPPSARERRTRSRPPRSSRASAAPRAPVSFRPPFVARCRRWPT